MQELRLAAVSEDGTYLVLASAGRGTRFMLPVDDRLRAAVRGQFSRIGQYEIEVENPLRPKEIQSRIRQGETAEAISEISGIPIERVRWFESPVLQEREYVAQQAQRATVRQQGETAPGPALGDVVAERIGNHQLETGDAVWDSWKREDNTWQLKLVFLVAGEDRVAHWLYEPRRRSVTPADEEAVRFLTPGADDPVDLGPGSANVTPFVPRRSAPEPARPEPLRPQPPRPEPSRPDAPPPTAPQRSQEPSDPAASSAPPPAPPSAPPARSDDPGSGRTRITAERAAPPAAESAPAPAAPQRPEADEPEQSTREQAPPRQDPPRQDPPPSEPRETPAPAAATEAPQRPERPAGGRASVQSAEPPAASGQAAQTGRGTDQTEQTQHQDAPAAHRQEPPVPAAAAGTSGPAGGSGSGSARRKGRGRRASVPSWDEIMFGSKKSD